MKDLKHIHYFESLINTNYNELVEKAINDGDKAIGYTCFYAPEVLLNLDGAFGVRLRAPNSDATHLGTYYMSSFTCSVTRSLLERGLENGFNFLSGICASETCAQMNRAIELFQLLNLVDNEKFFVETLDIPTSVSENSYEYFEKQIKTKLLKTMKEEFNIDVSNEKIIEAVEMKNKLNEIMREILEFRKNKKSVKITGTEMHILNLVVKTCPVKLILPLMEETLKELKSRRADSASKYRARIVVVGSLIADYKFTELIEETGALVVADRYCFGSYPSYEHIELDYENPIRSIAKYYLDNSLCPRYQTHDKVKERRDYTKKLYEDFNADGILVESIKFCDYWGYEKAVVGSELSKESIPTVSIETNYTVSATGQLRTRIQAFVENLEIKKISKAKGK